VLAEHDQLVCSLDWARSSRQLLSCSHDRNVYVWTPPPAGGATTTWTPALVVHHLTRAALCCAWAPGDAKFAVGSGAGQVSICFFEGDNNWWVGKLVRGAHGASVLALAWHPTAPLLATACADGAVRVLAAAVRGVDAAPVGGDAKFGDVLLQWAPAHGWVHSLAWAPTGAALACVTHGGGAHVMSGLDAQRAGEWAARGQGAHGPVSQMPLAPGQLPWLSLIFLTDTLAIAAGFSCVPVVLVHSPTGWAVAGELSPTPDSASAAASKSAFSERLASFKSQTDRGESATAGRGGSGDGVPRGGGHMNTITCLRHMPGTTHGFSTSALDGRLGVWSAAPADLASAGLAALKV
jgi:actin related protein 2/3 complex subunit 1A/1B